MTRVGEGYHAGDRNITSKVKHIKMIKCLDCEACITASGQPKRCKPCSSLHYQTQQAIRAKQRKAERKAMKEELTHG